jgi:hypothetical protein
MRLVKVAGAVIVALAVFSTISNALKPATDTLGRFGQSSPVTGTSEAELREALCAIVVDTHRTTSDHGVYDEDVRVAMQAVHDTAARYLFDFGLHASASFTEDLERYTEDYGAGRRTEATRDLELLIRDCRVWKE